MTREELAKIFNEVEASIDGTAEYQRIIARMSEDLAAGKYSRETILVNGAVSLSKIFMFEVMQRVLDVPAHSPEVRPQNRE